MNTGRVNILLVVAALLALSGCATEPSGYNAGNPILSAADANSMISVEMRELEPILADEAVAANWSARRRGRTPPD